MLATITAHHSCFKDVLNRLGALRFAKAAARRRARAAERARLAELDRASLLALDDLGLLSGEGCDTEWGLLERAARLRNGWS